MGFRARKAMKIMSTKNAHNVLDQASLNTLNDIAVKGLRSDPHDPTLIAIAHFVYLNQTPWTREREAEILSALPADARGRLADTGIPMSRGFGDSVRFTISTVSELRMAQACGLISLGRGAEAVAVATAAHNEHPGPEQKIVLGRAYHMAGDPNEALRYLAPLIDYSDHWWMLDARFGAASAYLALGIPNRSIELVGGFAAGQSANADYILWQAYTAIGAEAQANARLLAVFESGARHPDVVAAMQALQSPTAAVKVGAATQVEPEPAAEATAQAPSRSIEQVRADIDALVGMDEVKEQMRELLAMRAYERRMAENGGPTLSSTRHMIFAGPPGTGKTTIARLMSEYLAAEGLLSTGAFVEASRETLVGQHLGSTAPKTREVIQRAMGGVLFIDEAYSLNQTGISGGDAFGREAVAELLAAMENHRDDLIVVIAGYRDEIKEFLASNAGLQSRFANEFEFRSYNVEELMGIAKVVAANSGHEFTPDALSTLRDAFISVTVNGRADELGNGRLARNLVERSIMVHAGRSATEDVTVGVIDPVDIVKAREKIVRG